MAEFVQGDWILMKQQTIQPKNTKERKVLTHAPMRIEAVKKHEEVGHTTEEMAEYYVLEDNTFLPAVKNVFRKATEAEIKKEKLARSFVGKPLWSLT